MGDLSHNDHKDKNQDSLRARACERLEKGLLPSTKAARTWGGRGSGLACSLCDRPILESDPEMELEFEGTATARALRFHLQCHSIWESERSAPTRVVWTAVEKALPPFGAVVEARLDIGAGRMVILSVLYLRAGGDEPCWVNATTDSPLPETWHPVEWRHVAESSEPHAETSATKRA